MCQSSGHLFATWLVAGSRATYGHLHYTGLWTGARTALTRNLHRALLSTGAYVAIEGGPGRALLFGDHLAIRDTRVANGGAICCSVLCSGTFAACKDRSYRAMRLTDT